MGSLLAAFGVVFVAELGDKTQLVALGFGARHRLAPVLVGVVVAYALSNLLSVVVGGLLGATLPTRAIALGGGVLFLGFAAWSLRSPRDEPGDPAVSPAAEVDPAPVANERDVQVIASVATAMFVAELGDKTMLATATLAAQGNPVLTWFGATAGIICAGTPDPRVRSPRARPHPRHRSPRPGLGRRPPRRHLLRERPRRRAGAARARAAAPRRRA